VSERRPPSPPPPPPSPSPVCLDFAGISCATPVKSAGRAGATYRRMGFIPIRWMHARSTARHCGMKRAIRFIFRDCCRRADIPMPRDESVSSNSSKIEAMKCHGRAFPSRFNAQRVSRARFYPRLRPFAFSPSVSFFSFLILADLIKRAD